MTKQIADLPAQNYAPPLHFFHPGGHVARFQLADFLPNPPPHPAVIYFEAPGGCGKTRAAFDLFNDFDGLKFWLAVAGWDSPDAYALALNLACAANTITAKNTDEAQKNSERFTELTRTGGLATEIALGIVLEERLKHLRTPVCFLVDDAHLLLNDPALPEVLGALSRVLPAASLLLLTSRRNIHLSGLAATRVDESRLRFSPADTRKALLRHGASPDKGALQSLVQRYQGHPLSCCLAGLNLEDGTHAQIEAFEQDGVAPGQPLSTKAATLQVMHALQKETPDAQRLLRASALLHTFDAQDCDVLLGQNDSATTLGALRNSVLLTHVDGEWRHAHDLIRETLLQTLQNTATPQELNDLRLRAGQIYARRGFTQEALANFVAGGHRQPACDLVEQNIWGWLDESDVIALQRHLDILPVEWVEDEPVLLIAKANAQQGLEQRGFLGNLRKAKRIAGERGETSSSYWAQMEIAMMLNLEDRWPEAELEMCHLSDKQLSQMPLQLQIRYWQILANVHRGMERHQLGIQYADIAMELLKKSGNTKAWLRLWRDKNWAYQGSGQHRIGIKSAFNLVAFCKKTKQSELTIARNEYQALWMMIELGEHEEARVLLEKIDSVLPRIAPDNQPSLFRRYVFLRRMDYFRMIGEFEKAEEYLNQLKDVEEFTEWKYDRCPQIYLALGSLNDKRRAEFRDLMDWSWEFFVKNSHRHSSSGQIIYHIFKAASLLLGKTTVADLDAAESILLAAWEISKHTECEREKAQLHFWLAWLYHLKKKFSARNEHLQICLDLASRQSAKYVYLSSPQPASELWAIALEQDIHAEQAEILAKQPYVHRFTQPFVKLLSHPNHAVRMRARRIVQHHSGQKDEGFALLEDCKPLLRPLFETWLSTGWLTAEGLSELRVHLTWKQTQIFLAWLSPECEGSIKQAGVLCGVSLDNARVHLTTTKRILRDKIHAPASPATHGEFLRWAQELGWIKTYIGM